MNKEKISNPLTIVGIFAGIAEVAGTTVVSFLSKELQSTFIWYVMGFPVLLVILFFLTWNFNPSVLYSPSDYRNEDNFLTILTKKYKADIVEIERSIDGTKKDIVKEVTKILEDKNIDKPENIERIINNKMNEISNKLKQTESSASEYIEMLYSGSLSSLQMSIISMLRAEGELAGYQISKKLGISPNYTSNAMKSLVDRGIVQPIFA